MKKITDSSLGVLIYIRQLGVFIVDVCAGEKQTKSHFGIFRSTSFFSLSLNIYERKMYAF